MTLRAKVRETGSEAHVSQKHIDDKSIPGNGYR